MRHISGEAVTQRSETQERMRHKSGEAVIKRSAPQRLKGATPEGRNRG